MEIKVEKNVILPRKASEKYPFKEMEVGDSFLACKERSPQRQSSIATTARQWALSNTDGWKFTVRKLDTGIRVWRTK